MPNSSLEEQSEDLPLDPEELLAKDNGLLIAWLVLTVFRGAGIVCTIATTLWVSRLAEEEE